MPAFEIGVLVPLTAEKNVFAQVRQLDMAACQLCCWDPSLYSPAQADRVNQQARASNVTIAALWAGWTGPAVWDFLQGPQTLGIVPRDLRPARIEQLKQAADFAALIDTPAIITHLGFIPENPADPLYDEVIAAVRDVGAYCGERNLGFWFESGQETPVTLMRLIEDAQLPNLGINFDTANVVLYGKANPLDAAEVFGKYVRQVHAKDGLYPTDPRKLGREVPIGSGKADFPAILQTLKAAGFQGQVIIEREIEGDQQIKDIQTALIYLRQCVQQLP